MARRTTDHSPCTEMGKNYMMITNTARYGNRILKGRDVSIKSSCELVDRASIESAAASTVF